MFDLITQNTAGSTLKEFPETIETESGVTAKLSSQRIILTECVGRVAIGVYVEARKRIFSPTENGFDVTEKVEKFGEFEYVPVSAAIFDVVKTVNNLVDKIVKHIAAWG